MLQCFYLKNLVSLYKEKIIATYAIITFHTTHFALKAKRILKKKRFDLELIPLPREFSANCGFCLQISWKKKDEILELLFHERGRNRSSTSMEKD